MSSVKTAEATRNRRQNFALTPFRLASSCATISAEFGESFLSVIAQPPRKSKKSPCRRYRLGLFCILAAAQLHAVMTAIAVNSFRPNPTQRGGGRACNAHSAARTHLLFLAKGSPQFASNRGDHFGSIGISENPCILLEPLENPQISATLLPRKVRHAEFFAPLLRCLKEANLLVSRRIESVGMPNFFVNHQQTARHRFGFNLITMRYRS